MRISTLTSGAESCARACAIALGFSIPISVALDNVLLALVLLLWLVSANYAARLERITHNRVALAALILFALLIAGLAYGTREPGDGLHYVGKYADLAFIPLFATLFNTERARHLAWVAFAAGMALTLVLSCLLWSGMLGHDLFRFADGGKPAVFKYYLTQNILMAFGALVFAQLARAARVPWQRRLWTALAALAVVNVALMSPGRTGQVILFVLVIYFVHSLWSWRGILYAAAAIALMAGIGLVALGNSSNRYALALDEMQTWQPGQATNSSIGLRLGFYRNSLDIAREHPLIGNGTGSFPKAYADRVAGTAEPLTTNPHSEFLNIAVQLGLMGVAAMLYLFGCVWHYARNLPAYEHVLARGLVVTMAIGCLFNSLLMDHTEGLLFGWASGLLFAALNAPAEQRGAA
ncbi:MAG: O-antigen ligase family protein [Burkholderiales bacterium]